MIKVMFVCHGNICRSPMAEFVLKDLVNKRGISDKFKIASSATSCEELGNNIHYGTRAKLTEKGVPFENRRAVRFQKTDYDEYDYILVMDTANIRGLLRIIGQDTKGKIKRFKDFADGGDIADPWYTGNFDDTYRDISKSSEAFLRCLEERCII